EEGVGQLRHTEGVGAQLLDGGVGPELRRAGVERDEGKRGAQRGGALAGPSVARGGVGERAQGRQLHRQQVVAAGQLQRQGQRGDEPLREVRGVHRFLEHRAQLRARVGGAVDQIGGEERGGGGGRRRGRVLRRRAEEEVRLAGGEEPGGAAVVGGEELEAIRVG